MIQCYSFVMLSISEKLQRNIILSSIPSVIIWAWCQKAFFVFQIKIKFVVVVKLVYLSCIVGQLKNKNTRLYPVAVGVVSGIEVLKWRWKLHSQCTCTGSDCFSCYLHGDDFCDTADRSAALATSIFHDITSIVTSQSISIYSKKYLVWMFGE